MEPNGPSSGPAKQLARLFGMAVQLLSASQSRRHAQIVAIGAERPQDAAGLRVVARLNLGFCQKAPGRDRRRVIGHEPAGDVAGFGEPMLSQQARGEHSNTAGVPAGTERQGMTRILFGTNEVSIVCRFPRPLQVESGEWAKSRALRGSRRCAVGRTECRRFRIRASLTTGSMGGRGLLDTARETPLTARAVVATTAANFQGINSARRDKETSGLCRVNRKPRYRWGATSLPWAPSGSSPERVAEQRRAMRDRPRRPGSFRPPQPLAEGGDHDPVEPAGSGRILVGLYQRAYRAAGTEPRVLA